MARGEMTDPGYSVVCFGVYRLTERSDVFNLSIYLEGGSNFKLFKRARCLGLTGPKIKLTSRPRSLLGRGYERASYRSPVSGGCSSGYDEGREEDKKVPVASDGKRLRNVRRRTGLNRLRTMFNSHGLQAKLDLLMNLGESWMASKCTLQYCDQQMVNVQVSWLSQLTCTFPGFQHSVLILFHSVIDNRVFHCRSGTLSLSKLTILCRLDLRDMAGNCYD
ncbi:hypothetical protein Hypma_005029, partial [Hypsizygus marmoreus]